MCDLAATGMMIYFYLHHLAQNKYINFVESQNYNGG